MSCPARRSPQCPVNADKLSGKNLKAAPDGAAVGECSYNDSKMIRLVVEDLLPNAEALRRRAFQVALLLCIQKRERNHAGQSRL